METTRRFPRTTGEAFKRTTEYACPIEIHVGRRSLWWHFVRFIKGLL